MNVERKVISDEKYKLGRKVVQREDWYGLRAGRVGWVTDVWPRTRVLFEDGREPDVLKDLCSILEPTDEYCDDMEALRERVREKVERTRARVTRKASYR